MGQDMCAQGYPWGKPSIRGFHYASFAIKVYEGGTFLTGFEFLRGAHFTELCIFGIVYFCFDLKNRTNHSKTLQVFKL